ncbi:MAG TPA: hypothetical protein VJT31_37255 [Rugosimonospora sp.]|nr:hypothetical protein [Rugosimonospora sp.]
METHDLTGDEYYRSTELVEIDGATWCLVIHWSQVGGRAEAIGIEAWSRRPFHAENYEPAVSWDRLHPEGVPITSGVLRRLNIASRITQTRRDAIRSGKIVAKAPEFSEKARAAGAESVEVFARPGRPQARDLRFYQEVSRAYQAAYARGKAPTRAVAEQFGVSQAQAAKLVRTARHRYGLLAASGQGRAAGVVQD